MLVVLLHIHHLLCEGCRRYALLVKKCHVSGFCSISPTCSVSGVARRYALLVNKYTMLVVWLHIPTGSVSGVAWRYANLVRNAMLVVLLHIPNCSVSGVAWRYASLVKRCHVSGFAPYPPPALSVVSCEKKNMLGNKNAMLVVLPHIPHLLCEWCRLKIWLAI